MNSTKIELSKSFILIIALLVSISPLATDTYLAAFTQMSIYYDTPINMIEITLSVYLFGYGLGQLVGGPLADRYGRKLFILLGIVIFSISSVSIVFTSNIEYFWILRITQAFGSGFTAVNSLAMIRDLYSGKDAARVMTVVSMVMMLAPILAPVIGTAIINFTTWHYIFIFLAGYSLIGIFFAKKLSETSSKDKDAKAIQNYKKVLSEKLPVLLMIAGSLSFSGLFIFITKSSFMYMEVFKFTPNEFTMVYALNVFMLVIFGTLNMKLLKNYSLFQLLLVGVSMQLIFALLLLILYPIHNLYSITILMMLFIGSLGFIFANAFALILENFKALSGTANALNGVMNSLIAGGMAFIVSLLHDGTLLPMLTMMVGVTLVSFLIVFFNKEEIKILSS